MRVFLAGASGVIGQRLVPLLVADGHVVGGMTRRPARARQIEAAGAVAVVCDVFDRARLEAAVVEFAPEVVLHELTALPARREDIAAFADANNRIRREGTRNLLAAAEAAGATHFLAESVAWPLPGNGGRAVACLESAVLAAGGVVLRYGQFYGPGTYYEALPPPHPRVHVEDAARRTVPLLTAPSGTVFITETPLEEAPPHPGPRPRGR